MKWLLWISLVLTAAHASAGESFELGRRFREAAGVSDAQMQQVQPALQEHAAQLQGIAAKFQGQGLAQLPQVEDDLKVAQTNLQSAVSGILDPANLDKLEELHGQMGEELQAQLLEGTAGDVMKSLQASADQAKALKPLVSGQLEELGELFSSAWKTGGLEALPELQKSIEAHRKQFDEGLAKILSADQMATFQQQRDDILQKFEGELGNQDVATIVAQLGNLGQHKDEVNAILQDGFKAKADTLRATGGDIQKQLQATGEEFAGVDEEIRNQIQGVLGDKAADQVDQIQQKGRQALRSRLGALAR